jgi:hypothetical protein
VFALEGAELGLDDDEFVVALDLSRWKVEKLPSSWASGCKGLVLVEFPVTVRLVCYAAFSKCESLVRVSLSCARGLEEIGARCFNGCISLLEVDVPGSVIRIGMWAFANCGFVELDLGHLNGGLKVGACAFEFCSSLVELILPAGARVGADVLNGGSLDRLRIGPRVDLNKKAFEGVRVSELELSDENERVKEWLGGNLPGGTVTVSEGLCGCLGRSRVICAGATTVIEEEVPDLTIMEVHSGWTIWGGNALEVRVFGEAPESLRGNDCVHVLDLLNANVTKLEMSEMRFLRRLVAPSVLEKVSRIWYCPRLEEVIFGKAPVREFGWLAFEGDYSLVHVPLPTSLESVAGFEQTSISSLDARECALLKEMKIGRIMPLFRDVILPCRFSGFFVVKFAKVIERSTFGAVTLGANCCRFILRFGEVRFTALGPPRGDFVTKMFTGALVFSERTQVLDREAAPALPP